MASPMNMPLPPQGPQPPQGPPGPAGPMSSPGMQMGGQDASNLAAMQQQSQIQQTAGVLENLKQLTGEMEQVQQFLSMIATQYPGSAQYVRSVSEALALASKGMVDVVGAVVSQAQMEPAAPPYLG
jgi:hypothetical protein